MNSKFEYEFLVSNEPHLKAYGAFRGHAIRKALQIVRDAPDNTDEPVKSSSSSQRTVELRDSLRTRFRLGQAVAQKKKSGTAALVVQSSNSAIIVGLVRSTDGKVARSTGAAETHTIQSFGNHAVDPFNSTPVLSNSGVEMLLRYFIVDIIEVYGQRSWFEFAMTEGLLMNITLVLSATLWLNAYPNLDPKIRREGIFRKGEAIRAANALLRRSAASDILIASVAKLCHIAGAEGALDEAQVHLNGLCELIKMRGGVQKLRNSLNVARCVTWADLQVAAAVGRAPLLPLIFEIQEIKLPQGLLEEVKNPSLDYLDFSDPCSSTLKKVLILLRQVIIARKGQVTSPRDIFILLNTADMYILDYINYEPFTTEERRSKIMLLAAHVLSHIALRKWHRTGPVARILIRRLMDAIGMPEIDMLVWRGQRPGLLWTLLIGAVAVEGDKDGIHDWLTSRFQNVARSLALEERRDLERTLSLFVWDESFSLTILDKHCAWV